MSTPHWRMKPPFSIVFSPSWWTTCWSQNSVCARLIFSMTSWSKGSKQVKGSQALKSTYYLQGLKTNIRSSHVNPLGYSHGPGQTFELTNQTGWAVCREVGKVTRKKRNLGQAKGQCSSQPAIPSALHRTLAFQPGKEYRTAMDCRE